jgi:1-acyl-sn-glycerol-3-phosphate acyltransferase
MQPLSKKVLGPLLRAYSRLRIRGAENVPRSGPLVIAANHRSMLDIPLMVVASPRPVLFMAKRELFGDPVRARLWIEWGGFPVRREIADIRSLDMALAVLERGEALVLYPEGTRSKTAKMLPYLEGAAWLALRVGAPIVPAGVIGTGREPGWNGKASPWVGKHILVSFGLPIEVEAEPDSRIRRQKAVALTELLVDRISSLMA